MSWNFRFHWFYGLLAMTVFLFNQWIWSCPSHKINKQEFYEMAVLIRRWRQNHLPVRLNDIFVCIYDIFVYRLLDLSHYFCEIFISRFQILFSGTIEIITKIVTQLGPGPIIDIVSFEIWSNLSNLFIVCFKMPLISAVSMIMVWFK